MGDLVSHVPGLEILFSLTWSFLLGVILSQCNVRIFFQKFSFISVC